jgi:hypothetical protein
MKQKLFENLGGNTFKLINESANSDENSPLLRGGLRKIFMNAGNKITYKHLEGIGMGYIRNVVEAKNCAIKEARILAKEYGYMDNENSQAFVKEDETNMSDPAEAREVQIGKRIIEIVRHMKPLTLESNANEIEQLAVELIQMHGQR